MVKIMLLTLNNIEAGYDAVKALHGISLDIPEGAIVTLLGANGAGKTTTLKVISGIVRPTGGTIQFEGEPLNNVPPESIVKRGIVQVPEGRRVFASLTVIENLKMGAFVRRDTARVMADMDRIFDLFPVLQGRGKQLAGSLSGGEQQMLVIGRALMARPRLLLMDEPSLGLAPLIVSEIFEIIRSINDEDQTTLLIVEQNAQMALRIADYGYVLQVGKVAVSGSAVELRQNEEVIRSYMGGEKSCELSLGDFSN